MPHRAPTLLLRISWRFGRGLLLVAPCGGFSAPSTTRRRFGCPCAMLLEHSCSRLRCTPAPTAACTSAVWVWAQPASREPAGDCQEFARILPHSDPCSLALLRLSRWFMPAGCEQWEHRDSPHLLKPNSVVSIHAGNVGESLDRGQCYKPGRNRVIVLLIAWS